MGIFVMKMENHMNPDNPNFRELKEIDFKGRVKDFELVLIMEALSISHNNQSMASRILGISRSTLIKKVKELEAKNK